MASREYYDEREDMILSLKIPEEAINHD